jgi:hypothetical protein
MKPIFTLIVLASLSSSLTTSQAQKIYTISTNTSWSSAAYPSYCNACTFTISSGKTLTIDKSSVSCANCIFSSGNISITKDFTCQSCNFISDSYL